MLSTIALSDSVRQPNAGSRRGTRKTDDGLNQVPSLIVPQTGLCITFALPASVDAIAKEREDLLAPTR
jgi:hypothetical protein